MYTYDDFVKPKMIDIPDGCISLEPDYWDCYYYHSIFLEKNFLNFVQKLPCLWTLYIMEKYKHLLNKG